MKEMISLDSIALKLQQSLSDPKIRHIVFNAVCELFSPAPSIRDQAKKLNVPYSTYLSHIKSNNDEEIAEDEDDSALEEKQKKSKFFSNRRIRSSIQHATISSRMDASKRACENRTKEFACFAILNLR